MLFTLMQVNEVLAVIGSVPEGQLEPRAALVIAFVQQTLYRDGK